MRIFTSSINSFNVGVEYRMSKHIIWLVGFLLLLLSCGEKMAYRIEGKLSNLEDQTLYAVFENDGGAKEVDTIMCEEPGHFLIERMQGDFQEITLFFNQKTQWITVYPEKGKKITISGDVEYPAMLQVKGGRLNDRLSDMKNELTPLLKEQTDLLRQLGQGKKGGVNRSIKETDVASRLANVNHQLEEAVAEIVKKNPDETASVVLLQQYFMKPDDTRMLDELLAVLDPKLKDFYLVRSLEGYSERVNRTALGAEAPDFDVKDIYGTPVCLDSFPQKYVLLAFTAPWCDMCQTEDLFLDEIAMQYSKDKLDMLLVSLDDDQRRVRKVLAKDSIDWNLVTDSAGQAVMLFDLYNVNALPRCFLIDEEKKIILKTDNGIEVKQTLEKLIE